MQYASDYVCAFMTIRMFFLFKSRFNYSKYRDAFSKTICKEHKFYPSNWFILKVKFDKKPVKTVLILLITSILTLTSILCLFELENFMTSAYTRDYSPFFTAFYFTMITITTVGYGNITP